MKLLILNTHDPYYNLALEEYLFNTADEDIFMLWQNDPTVVIGKNQNAYAEINMDQIKEKNIAIARRITGGGAVYHDSGNVNYSFISPKDPSGKIDFAYFTAPIIDALGDMGITATLSGRNDLLTGGKKFSGNAQHASSGRVLHHGTLLFDSDLTVLSSVLHVDEEKLKSKAIRSARSRVTNLKSLLVQDMTVGEFINAIAERVISRYGAELMAIPSSPDIDALRERNSSREWIFPERDLLSKYSLLKKKRFDFGTVEIYLEMKNDIIVSARILGDFFGKENIIFLEEFIVGKSLSDAKHNISKICVSDYILGMTEGEFCDLLNS